MQPPVFDGDVEGYSQAMGRWFRLSGVSSLEDKKKIDWILQSSSQRCLPVLEKIVMQNAHLSLEQFLSEMERLFPKIENDISLKERLKSLSVLPKHPTPQDVEVLLLNMEVIFQKLSPGAISPQDKVLLLNSKINPWYFKELRSVKQDRSRMEDYDSLAALLREKTAEDVLEKYLFQQQRSPQERINALVQVKGGQGKRGAPFQTPARDDRFQGGGPSDLCPW